MTDNSCQCVGQGEYTVEQGECLSSVAYKAGHLWQTIWNDPANADLKAERKDPNILLPGDRLTIPALREREESCATDQTHRFRRRGVPETLRLVVRRWGDPIANERYLLIVDGALAHGQTDGDGKLEQPIRPDAREAVLKIGSGEDTAEYRIDLGCIDPIESITGIQERLLNLGIYLGEIDGRLGEETIGAIADFCGQNGIDPPADGELSDEFRSTLKEVYGF